MLFQSCRVYAVRRLLKAIFFLQQDTVVKAAWAEENYGVFTASRDHGNICTPARVLP